MSLKVVYTSVAPIEIDREGFKKLGVEFVQKPSPTEDDLIAIAKDAYTVIIGYLCKNLRNSP